MTFLRTSCPCAYSEISCARKVLAVLVEGHGHDTVCGVERLFHTITMVNVNIYVQHSLMVPEARKDLTIKTMIDQVHPNKRVMGISGLPDTQQIMFSKAISLKYQLQFNFDSLISRCKG